MDRVVLGVGEDGDAHRGPLGNHVHPDAVLPGSTGIPRPPSLLRLAAFRYAFAVHVETNSRALAVACRGGGLKG